MLLNTQLVISVLAKKQDARKRWDATKQLRWSAPAHNEQLDPIAARRLSCRVMVPPS